MQTKNQIHFEQINKNKADFSSIYCQLDPRLYFRELGNLDYIIPQVANTVFQQLVRERLNILGDGVIRVLDLGASYGVNGAMLKYPVTWDMMRNRYQIAEFEGLVPDELGRLDSHYYRSWPRRPHVEVIGLDVSQEAIDYAVRVGTLDAGFAVNLEQDEPGPELVKALQGIDLIISTGSVGYITERTFLKLVKCGLSGRKPWVASFVLRMFPYDRIADCLLDLGLVTERFEGATFVQRRFANSEEMKSVVSRLHRNQVVTTDKEERGYYHAELFVSRPSQEIARYPINQMVSLASGENRLFAGLAPRVSVPSEAAADLPPSAH
ncbi:MAG: class I SAM-dependent methyltransferase [Xanthobacteraceae bacterium]|nr:MAG: class I SAM-dependent methyltransferase [Xanthobacteraceae bacterium]